MIHPGPRAEARVQAVRATLVPVSGQGRAGQSVMQAVAAIFADAGCRGGVMRLDGALCDPLRYVLPAFSTDGLHAAWYSDEIPTPGPVRIGPATAIVGQRDGQTFLHCHGIWSAADGAARMGHLLPLGSVLAEDVVLHGIGSTDARFDALPDEETAFTLFQPQGGGAGRGLLARLRPGEDVATAIASLCANHGITDARVHGVGSIDHIRFQDGTRVDCMATELRFADASLRVGCPHLPIQVVDTDGRIHSGILAEGENPVGVTVEIVIETRNEE